MKILISAPSGYNTREILLPLRKLLSSDDSLSSIYVITPAAPFRNSLFPTFGSKFDFHSNPDSQTEHNNLFRRLKPDVVITPTIGLDPKDTFILRAAKNNSIPTLTFIASWDNIFKMDRLKSRGHSGATKRFAGAFELPDYFAVWNSLNRAHLQKIFPEFPPANITITGPPRFDYFSHSQNIPGKKALFDYLNIKSSAPDTHLIHCATTELYPFEYIIQKIYSSFSSGKNPFNYHLHTSVHPGGDISKHLSCKKYNSTVMYSFGRKETPPHPDFAYLPSDEENYYLISLFKHTSILVNQSSTVAIESMRCNVPVINVMYGRKFDWINWHRSMVYRDFKQHYRYITDDEATSVVKKPSELIRSINQYIADPNIKGKERISTTKKLITHIDGSCGKKLLDLAKSIG